LEVQGLIAALLGPQPAVARLGEADAA
jgi:hypothetical protein